MPICMVPVAATLPFAARYTFAPALIAQFIITFIGAYNDYMGPLIYLQDASMYTLQIALAFFADVYTQNWPLRMAGCVVAMLPLIILYLIFFYR